MSKFNYKEDFTWHDFLVRLSIIIGTVAVIVIAMPRDSQNYFHVEQGKPWKYADFTAPFDFPIYKSETRIKQEQDSILSHHEPYYQYDKSVENDAVSRFLDDYKDGIPGLGDDYISIISNRLHRIYQAGIMKAKDYGDLISDTTRQILLINGKESVRMPVTQFYSTKNAYEVIINDEKLEAVRATLQKCNLDDYIKENVVYDKRLSEASLKELMSGIPIAIGVVQKGEKVVEHGEIVDEKTYRMLLSFVKENEKRGSDNTRKELSAAGEAIYMFIIISLFTIYLTLFRKDYFDKTRSFAMLYSLIIIFALLTALFVRSTFLHVYILPYAIVPIFVRVFMDSRTAFMAHFTMIIVCACMLKYPFEFIVIESVAGLVAIYSLRELQYRSQLFKTVLFVAMSCMLSCLAFDLIRINAISDFDFSYYKYLVANAVLMLFAYPLIYLLEKMFGFTSDITLIELSNTNNAILRQLSEMAPGTFQHSIQVGNLGAEIANRIGADAQLVRTGALYHDIGKISNPIYFTENQSGFNPHEGLSSVESAQIIISHVTEGLKLAEKFNLPQIIKDFINTHHGQGKAKFFYIKYKNEHPDEEVDELLFTYPGVNPFTREQAILMMADAVEAASRSLPEYTEQSIRSLVEKIINGQVSDGYFRDCPITFRDIAYAKTVLIEKLKTTYHTRVIYPELNKT